MVSDLYNFRIRIRDCRVVLILSFSKTQITLSSYSDQHSYSHISFSRTTLILYSLNSRDIHVTVTVNIPFSYHSHDSYPYRNTAENTAISPPSKRSKQPISFVFPMFATPCYHATAYAMYVFPQNVLNVLTLFRKNLV